MSSRVDRLPGRGDSGASQSIVSPGGGTTPDVDINIIEPPSPGAPADEGLAGSANDGSAQAQADTAAVIAQRANLNQKRRQLADQRRAAQTQANQREKRDANAPVSSPASSLARDEQKKPEQSRKPSALAAKAVEEALAGNASQVYEEPTAQEPLDQDELDKRMRSTGYVDAGRSGTGEIIEHQASEPKQAAPAKKATPKKGKLGRVPLGEDSGEGRGNHPADKVMDFMARQKTAPKASAPARPAPVRDDFSDMMDRESTNVEDAAARGEVPSIDPRDVEEAAEETRYGTRDELLAALRKADDAAWEPMAVKKAGGKTDDEILKAMQARSTEKYVAAEAKAGAEAYPEEERYERRDFADITREDEIEYDKRGKYREMTQDFIKYPWLLNIESETRKTVGEEPRKKGQGAVYRRELSKRSTDNLRALSKAWAGSEDALSTSTCLRIILVRGGIAVDTQGNIGGVPADQFALPEETLVRLCRDAILATERTGNPFAMIPGELPIMKGTRCYPLGYCPSFLMDELRAPENSKWHDKSKEECAKIVGDEWLQHTLPAIIANTNHDGVGGMSQRYALYEGMRALLALDGQTNSARSWGITAEAEFTALQMMEETSNLKAAGADSDIVLASEEASRRVAKSTEAIRRQAYKKVKRVERDENGEHVTSEKEVYRDNVAQQGMHLVAALMRTNGLLFNIPVMASNFAEKWQSNCMTIIANKLLMQRLRSSDYFTSDELEAFVVKDTTKEISVSDEAKDCMDALQLLFGVGGADAFIAFSGSEMPLTKDGVRKFLNEMIGREGDLNKAQRMMNSLNNIMANMMGGNYGTRGIDNKRMLEMLMYNMAVAKKNGKRYIDAETMDKAIFAKSYGDFIKDMMAYPETLDAFISTTNLNMGRVNPTKRQIELLLKRSAIIDIVGSTALDTYITYGANVVQALMPFSNTISYLTLNAANDGFESDMSSYQLGGTDEFRDGLAKNIVYDGMKLGNNLLLGFVVWGAIQILGIDEPPEDYNKYDWVEYAIGGEKRVPAWWLNDLVGWGLPFGVALAVTQKWGTERGWKVFQSGMFDMMEGSSVIDALELITHSGENMEKLSNLMGEDDYMAPPNMESFLRAQAMHFFVAEPISKLTPYPVNNLLPFLSRDTMLVGQDAKDKTATQVYDRDSYDAETAEKEHRTKSVDDYEEQMIRRDTKNNWLYALGMNVFRNGYLLDTGDTANTGYAWYEMPTATRKGPDTMWWYGKNEFSYDDAPQGSEAERQAWLDQKATEVLEDLGPSEVLGIKGKFTSPEQAVANGFALSYNARTNAIDYCYRQIALLELDYTMHLQAGDYQDYEKGVAANTEKKQKVSAYYDIVNNWLKNDEIPWRDVGYERLITDWNKVYRKEDGSPATEWEWMFSPITGEIVTVEYVPRGNHPTSFAPYTTVDPTGRGFNEETIPSYYSENLTDTQLMYDTMNDGSVINMGIDAGRYPNQVMFGGQGDQTTPDEDLLITPGTEMIPTIGQRSWEPFNMPLPDEIKDMDQGETAKTMGIDMDELKEIQQGIYDGKTASGKPISGAYNTWVRYGGNRSSYGGGTTYSPKIYSNPRSVNADYAKGMSVRQPYGASKTYLRPNFETKGSREAYRRSDF